MFETIISILVIILAISHTAWRAHSGARLLAAEQKLRAIERKISEQHLGLASQNIEQEGG